MTLVYFSKKKVYVELFSVGSKSASSPPAITENFCFAYDSSFHPHQDPILVLINVGPRGIFTNVLCSEIWNLPKVLGNF